MFAVIAPDHPRRDDLRSSAADVDPDQATAGALRKRAHHRAKREARLALAVDHLERRAEQRRGAREKVAGALGTSRRTG